MSSQPTLTTPRLILRPWRDDDLPAYAAMNADPRVMQFFQKTWTPQESAATLGRVRAHFDRHGFGKWAVEAPGVAPLVGLVGLAVPDYDLPFNPCVEIGWRLAAEVWGRGYATEAARAALDFAFRELRVPEVVAFTVPANARSRAVMERLGMTRNPAEDFDHPMIPVGHPVRRHVLYRLSASAHDRAK
jgi:ribosomal-protein-alanine N-acetyltransferase